MEQDLDMAINVLEQDVVLDWEWTGGERITALIEMWIVESQNMARLVANKDVKEAAHRIATENKKGDDKEEADNKFNDELDKQFYEPLKKSRSQLKIILGELLQLAEKIPDVFEENVANWAVLPKNLSKALRSVLPGKMQVSEKQIEEWYQARRR